MKKCDNNAKKFLQKLQKPRKREEKKAKDAKNAENAKNNAYIDRFIDLQSKGYTFIPVGIESSGGISKNLRHIIKIYLKQEAKLKNKELSILCHNFYIRFSIFIQKLRFNAIWSRVKGWR